MDKGPGMWEGILGLKTIVMTRASVRACVRAYLCVYKQGVFKRVWFTAMGSLNGVRLSVRGPFL